MCCDVLRVQGSLELGWGVVVLWIECSHTSVEGRVMIHKRGIKLIELEWEDHWLSSSDWTAKELFHKENRLHCTTVGYLIAEDAGHYFISSQLEQTGSGAYRGVNSILKVCVTRKRVLGVRLPRLP